VFLDVSKGMLNSAAFAFSVLAPQSLVEGHFGTVLLGRRVDDGRKKNVSIALHPRLEGALFGSWSPNLRANRGASIRRAKIVDFHFHDLRQLSPRDWE